jgi:hypothetical protein
MIRIVPRPAILPSLLRNITFLFGHWDYFNPNYLLDRTDFYVYSLDAGWGRFGRSVIVLV